MAGERMSNYKWQAPAPNMQLLFKQAIYNPLDGACREWGVCSLGVVWAQSARKGRVRLPLTWGSLRNRGVREQATRREQQRVAKIPSLISPLP